MCTANISQWSNAAKATRGWSRWNDIPPVTYWTPVQPACTKHIWTVCCFLARLSCLFVKYPWLCHCDTCSDEPTNCQCDVTVRDVWVRKIESASKHYLETERKKRERAHHGELYVVIHQVSQLCCCCCCVSVSECSVTSFRHLIFRILRTVPQTVPMLHLT